MYKLYLLLDTGTYFMNVIELSSSEEIEIYSEVLEDIIPLCIENNSCNYMIDNEEIKELFNEYEEIEGYTYLDLSHSNLGYNIYLDIRNMRTMEEVPKTYNINLKIDLDKMVVLDNE